jgi:triacylglycerol lipase
MSVLPVAGRSASWPSLAAFARRTRAGNRTTMCRPAGPQRQFGAYAPLYRHIAPTDARIEGLGKEIADEYALLRDNYSMPPPACITYQAEFSVGVGRKRRV